MCSVHHFNRSNITLFIPFKTVKWETCPVLSFFLLLLRTELSWNIKTIKLKIANRRASCLDSCYLLIHIVLRDLSVVKINRVFSCSIPHFLPNGNVIALHPSHHLPSLLSPPWPRLLSPGRCTGGLRCEIAKTWTIICQTERRALRAASIEVLVSHCHTQHSTNTYRQPVQFGGIKICIIHEGGF